jgi:hypothetical protein
LNQHGYTGQTYGTRAAQVAATRAVPVAPQPAPHPLGPPPPTPGAPRPGQLGDLLGPTTSHDEPVTAGADLGPGPSSDVLGIPTLREGDLDNLAARNLYPFMAWAAAKRGGPSTVAFVRNLRAGLT